MELNENQQKDLLNFANHFAERLQDALDADQHPWGSGNAMSDVLGEYDDWHKVNIDGQALDEEQSPNDEAEDVFVMLQKEYDEADETCEAEEKDEDGESIEEPYNSGFNAGFRDGIGHVIYLLKGEEKA